MADRVVPGPVDSSACVREAVCIHTKKIYSSCRDKDCVEDLRVFPTRTSQGYIENAFSIRPKSAELLYAGVNVEEITFNRGYYTVDVTYFYRVTGECVPNAKTVTGLCVFNKRVILFGSEGSVKVYTSDGEITTQADQPVGVVEAVDPIALSMQITEKAARPHPGGAGQHSRRVSGGACAHRLQPALVRDARSVFSHPARARQPARHPGLQLLLPGKRVRRHDGRRSMHALRAHPLPGGGILSARQSLDVRQLPEPAPVTFYYARKRRNFVRSGAFRHLIREPGG